MSLGKYRFNRNNKQKLNQIFYSVIFAKIILFVLCSLIFISFMFIPRFNNNLLVFTFTYLIMIGYILFPSWFYQGIEKLTTLALFIFIFRVIYTILIFLFIKNINDFILIPLSSSIAQIILAIAAFIYAIKKFNIKYITPKMNEIMERFFLGKSIFISSIAVNIYTSTNVVILGLFTSNKHVGYFSAAYKLISITSSIILIPISLSFFPHVGNLMNTSKEEGVNALKKLTLFLSILTMFSSIILFVFANYIIKVIFGEQFVNATKCLRIISFIPFISGLGNVFTVQGLLNLKMDKTFLLITFIGAGISIILNILFVPKYFENGTAIIWLVTEMFITLISYLVLLKNNINLFDFKISIIFT